MDDRKEKPKSLDQDPYFLLAQAEMDRLLVKDVVNSCGEVKVGRNLKCPCGSGRKYKHCCGSST